MPTIVQTFQGRVTGLWGTATIRDTDGKMRALKVGDLVHKGDVILTSQDGIVQLSPDDTATAAAAAARAESEPATAANAPTTASPDIDRVISGLNDPDSAEATAAGVTGGDGAGDLSPGLRVDRIAESTTAASLSLPVDEGRQFVEPIGVAEEDPVTAAQPLIEVDSNTINAT
ncbi:MAG: retention module-containing protein, partial [Burkholderiaceae bacterium]